MQQHGTFLLTVLFLSASACSEDSVSRARENCIPGQLRCAENGITEVCSLDGSGYQESSCAGGQLCVAGTDRTDCNDPTDCPDVCRDIICTPGERFCNAVNNVEVLVCNEDGTGATPCGSCAAPPTNGVCDDGQCVAICREDQKSYLGCEYYAVDLDNANVPCQIDASGELINCDAAGAQFAVVLANPETEQSAFVNISIGATSGTAPSATSCTSEALDDNVVTGVIIPPRGLKVVQLPRRDVNNTMKGFMAYRVGSNVPVTAYQFNPLENVGVFSNDASLLLPVNTAGTSYVVMSREQSFDSLKGFVTVVGVSDTPAEVTVTVTARTQAGDGIPALAPGDSYTTTVSRFEVLNIQTNFIGADLTGTRVEADRPVIVYAGSEAANAPNTSRCDETTNTCEFDGVTECGCTPEEGEGCSPDAKCSQFITCCADHLEQQMFPVETWGTNFVAVRTEPRNLEEDVWRLLAATEGTTVTLTPPVAEVPTLGAGEWFEFQTGADFRIEASDPILVGQFLAAQDAPSPGNDAGDAGTGDPAFILAVPERQFRTDYVFLAPDQYAFDFVSIAYRNGTTARLDNRLIEEIPNAKRALVPDSEWIAARVPISDGAHTLRCEENCSVIVHGYDQFVSYGYPGGLNLEDDN
ncbi:MAG: IgGFc-binding protein [Myxococcota bacterium]